ncbi:uncharacterized protein LOC127130114 [Lathyrus oleraceus]|uniref:uncharacterized protein LOC127130114 n=1 Tax=Pisum sativum TaxID=3888 RepID=UPI0021CE6AE8|nr:uncharacterized protein LOC127130114 [Pisum sativum]
MMFAFTSPTVKLDNSVNKGGGPPTLQIQVHNTMQGLRNTKHIDPNIVQQLSNILYEHNPRAKSYQMVRHWLFNSNTPNLKLRLISDRSIDGRIYNQPTVSEVAALVVRDIDTTKMRDIIMQSKGGHLQRINELHANYLAYKYPLILPYGKDGYIPTISHRDLDDFQDNKRNILTIRE